MATQSLTPLQVKNAKPRANRIEIADRGCKGLYLVVQPGGAKSWAVRYRYLGKPRKLTLGSTLVLGQDEAEPAAPTIDGAVTLSAARKLAADALHKVKQGVDPAKSKQDDIRAGNEAAAVRAEDSVANLAAQFIERYCKVKGNRSWGRTKRIFDKEVLPEWSGKTVHEITQDNVEYLIAKIAKDRPILANRALAAVRKWFAWMGGRYKGGHKAIMKSRLRTAPCVGIEPPGLETRRDRVLTGGEIRGLWAVCGSSEAGGIGEPFASFVKLLLLTGQRRSEVAGMRWSEIETGKSLWTIPGERTKNKLVHVVPLSPQAMEIVKVVTRIDKSDHVFTTTGDSGVGGFSRAKERIDERMKAATPWTFHDLRRTTSTGMAEIGIAPHVIEAVLNHVSGAAKAGVAGTYNKWAYQTEKTQALQRWGDHISRIVTGEPRAKVIRIRGAAR